MAIRDLWEFSKGQASQGIRELSKGDLRAWGLLLTPFLLWAVIEAPRWQASRVTSRDAEKYFEAENKARSTLLQGIGGALVFVTAYVALKQLRVAEDKNLTDRFVKAAELLANKEKMAARLGGIYTLERIARDSPEDHWTVIQLLISFIEDQPKGMDTSTVLGKDIHAALNVIGKRNVENDPKLVTGSRHVTKIEIRSAKLRHSNLSLLNFDQATFEQVHFSRSQLAVVSFKGASFFGCDFSVTEFLGADFSGAKFHQCNFILSKFSGTKLKGAHFFRCILGEVTFTPADLSEAFFEECNLSGTDFRLTEGLTEPKQVLEAANWKEAIYSPEFASKLPLTDEEREAMALIRQKTAPKIQLQRKDLD
jgi:uncharacterized protein YjbI with pentapeptide repeats